jgi:hypothetical protein
MAESFETLYQEASLSMAAYAHNLRIIGDRPRF